MTQDALTAPGRHSDASPQMLGGAFPGYSEDAPLDLSGLSEAAFRAVGTRLVDGTFDAFAETAAAVHNCAHPIRLVGSSETYELDPATGEVGGLLSSFDSADAPLGMLYRPCGNRRAEVCPACSRTYARDTFELIRAGLLGGKTMPATVADNPLLFATFTAPSFGHVHGHRDGKPCRPRNRDKGTRCPHGRPVACSKVHAEDDPANGAPLCWDCYDWRTAVVWQWWAPELWRRTTIALRRALADRLGVPESQLRKSASVQFVKVAEYQARGLVHFHALLRLDGPDGPGSPAPLDGRTLAQLLDSSARAVRYDAPPIDGDGVTRLLAWGRQLDIRVVRDRDRTDEPAEALTPGQVAGYLAKYATKDAGSIRDPDAPRDHLRQLGQVCGQIAKQTRAVYGLGVDEKGKPDNPYALLGKWAHMLGFRGHFSTKSRRYSVTLGRLRAARVRYQRIAATSSAERARLEALSTLELEALLLADDTETTLVVGDWAYQGSGWTSPGDEALALAAAARAREYDQWKAQIRTTRTNGGEK